MNRGTGALLLLLPALLLLTAPALASASPGSSAPAAVTPDAHYLPQVGDSLSFAETISLGGGEGNITGYWATDDVNGTLTITAVPGNGTDTASYDYVNHVWNSSGTSYGYSEVGTFTFSASSFLYVHGTDNQSGDNHTQVWFFVNNTLADGASISPLDTPMTIASRDADYDLGTGAGGFVSTIEAVGTGSYDDGGFTADYDYHEYFDPSTGYVVGYLYVEHDHNAQGDGYVYVDALHVTHTSFALTAGTSEKGYSVVFTQTGLGSTTVWAVVLGGWRYTGTGASITVTDVPNGSYVYLYEARGYTASPANGSLTIDGGPGSGATSWSVYPPPAAGVSPWLILAVFLVIIVIIALIVWLLVRRRRSRSGLPQHSAGGMPQFGPPLSSGIPPPINLAPGSQPQIQQVVVQEVVKVKCQYCGSLIDSTAPKCPFCGATRT